MAEKKIQRNFRPWDGNEERLVFAEKAGINPGDVINKSLERVGKKVIEEEIRRIREAISAPVP